MSSNRINKLLKNNIEKDRAKISPEPELTERENSHCAKEARILHEKFSRLKHAQKNEQRAIHRARDEKREQCNPMAGFRR